MRKMKFARNLSTARSVQQDPAAAAECAGAGMFYGAFPDAI
jgi:hypothetical protein